MNSQKLHTAARLAALLASFALTSLTHAQPARRAAAVAPTQPSVSAQADRPAAPSPEEALIRAAYEKLTRYNLAARHWKVKKDEQSDPDLVLRFELNNFHTGPVSEVLDTLYRDLVTRPTGEVIRLKRATVQLDYRSGPRDDQRIPGQEQGTFQAEWVSGGYASGEDRSWTVADIFRLVPAEFYDVEGYASYEVTVFFEGKTRTYRALALFHNPYRTTGELKPQFWDSVVGSGGVITDVWKEKLPPFRWQTAAPPADGTIAPEGGRSVFQPASYTTFAEGETVAAPDGSREYTAYSVGYPILWLDKGYDEHASGSHFGTAQFSPECTPLPYNMQRCEVVVFNDKVKDDGVLTNYLYSHSWKESKTTRAGNGQRGTQVDCESAVGASVSSCFFDCNVTSTLSVSGHGVNASVTVAGGELWNSAHIEGNACNIQPDTAGGACTTPTYNGDCPTNDYYYNEYGMCCYDGGVCNGAYAPGDATIGDDGGGGATPNPNLMEGGYGGCACDEMERNSCSSGGGEWSEAYCSCISPVVIDVNGDGFDLTDGAGGVLFDFTGVGRPTRLAWTRAGSDDAWLVLDRDDNGKIDSGRELFGTHTAQPAPPAGERRNGFRALAVYDLAGNGGNADGVIDSRDAIFSSLRLWQDTNHDGVSQPAELHTLTSLGVATVHLGYHESKRTDESGNRFRYRAKVDDAKGREVNRWAWDVFPVKPR